MASNHFSRVVEAGRRVTPTESLQDAAGKEKLTQKTIDFEKLEESGLKDEKADVIVIVVSRLFSLIAPVMCDAGGWKLFV